MMSNRSEYSVEERVNKLEHDNDILKKRMIALQLVVKAFLDTQGAE